MVKNTNGGNKSKGIARKHMTAGSRTLRLSTSEFEKYGVITKILGNGMFYVVTDISNEKQPHLLGHIRKKFKGRSKRDNTITLGSVILVGLRDWEGPNYKECDLLEAYDINEVRQLIKIPSIDLSTLQKYIDMFSTASGDTVDSSDIVFAEERDFLPYKETEEESNPNVDQEVDAIPDDIVDFDEM